MVDSKGAMLTRYEEAFWGPDFTSTAGYDVLARHNNDEKKYLQEFEEYLRKRGKIEQEYSKSIGQLAKSLKDHAVIGTLDMAWNTLKSELDTLRLTHEEAGQYFSQRADETKRFTKELTARRDTTEERVKKIQNQKISQYNKVQSLHKSYSSKCRDQDQANENYATIRRQVTCTTKELERAESKKLRAAEEAAKTDAAYKAGVHVLEEIRMEWEKEMEQACKDFQDSDEEQISFMRVEMWQAVNRDSQVALDVDESSERVRQVLEQCDIDQDIQNFIVNYTTGTQRPEKIPYQSYYNDSPNGGGNGQPSPRTENHQRKSDPQQRIPIKPLAPPVGFGNSSAIYSSVDDEPTYSVIKAPPRMLTVSKPYSSLDFSVQAGEKVKFVRQLAATMFEVETASNKVGKIPAACILEKV